MERGAGGLGALHRNITVVDRTSHVWGTRTDSRVDNSNSRDDIKSGIIFNVRV